MIKLQKEIKLELKNEKIESDKIKKILSHINNSKKISNLLSKSFKKAKQEAYNYIQLLNNINNN